MPPYKNKILTHASSKLGLLFVGFILTSIFGALVTFLFQYLSWERDKRFEIAKWERDKQFEIFKYHLESGEKKLDEQEKILLSRVYLMHRIFNSVDEAFSVKKKQNENMLPTSDGNSQAFVDEPATELEIANKKIKELWKEYELAVRKYNENYILFRVTLEECANKELADQFFILSKEKDDNCLHGKIRNIDSKLNQLVHEHLKNMKTTGNSLNKLRPVFNDLVKNNLPLETRSFINRTGQQFKIRFDTPLTFGDVSNIPLSRNTNVN